MLRCTHVKSVVKPNGNRLLILRVWGWLLPVAVILHLIWQVAVYSVCQVVCWCRPIPCVSTCKTNAVWLMYLSFVPQYGLNRKITREYRGICQLIAREFYITWLYGEIWVETIFLKDEIWTLIFHYLKVCRQIMFVTYPLHWGWRGAN